MFKKTITGLMSAALASAALASPQWQADVKVLSVEVKQSRDHWLCYSSVHNHWDDDAREAKAIVSLPVGVTLIDAATTAGAGLCSVNPYPGNTDSYVLCELGQMGVNQMEQIRITTTQPPKDIQNRQCSVFAYSETPDPNRANNFAVSQ